MTQKALTTWSVRGLVLLAPSDDGGREDPFRKPRLMTERALRLRLPDLKKEGAQIHTARLI